MTFDLANSPMVKADPSLLLPYPPISQAQRELVRSQLVEAFSSSPLYQQKARESGNEAEYWSKFSIGGIVHPLKT